MRFAAIAIFAIVFSPLARAEGRAELLAQLDAAEVKWLQTSTARYQFTFKYRAMFRYAGCETGSFRVRVTNDVPGKLLDCESLKDTFATVPLLFKYIRAVLAKKPDMVQLSFDPALGYPLKFEVDYSKDISDDYFIFGVSDFELIR